MNILSGLVSGLGGADILGKAADFVGDVLTDVGGGKVNSWGDFGKSLARAGADVLGAKKPALVGGPSQRMSSQNLQNNKQHIGDEIPMMVQQKDLGTSPEHNARMDAQNKMPKRDYEFTAPIEGASLEKNIQNEIKYLRNTDLTYDEWNNAISKILESYGNKISDKFRSYLTNLIGWPVGTGQNDPISLETYNDFIHLTPKSDFQKKDKIPSRDASRITQGGLPGQQIVNPYRPAGDGGLMGNLGQNARLSSNSYADQKNRKRKTKAAKKAAGKPKKQTKPKSRFKGTPKGTVKKVKKVKVSKKQQEINKRMAKVRAAKKK